MLIGTILSLLVSFVAAIFAWGGIIPDGTNASLASVVFVLAFLSFFLMGFLALIPKDAVPATQTTNS